MKWIRIAAALLLSVSLLSGCAPRGGGAKGTSDAAQTPAIPGVSDPTGTQDPSAPVTEESTQDRSNPIKLMGRFDERVSDTFSVYMKWTADAYEDMTATVTVELRLSCLDIEVPKRNGSITVNGETQSFKTPQIVIKVKEKQDLLLTKMTFEVELDEDDPAIELSAEWDFDQIYHGTEIDTVELSDRIVILELTDASPTATTTTSKRKELLPTPTEE